MTARTQKSFQRYKKMTAHLHRPPPTYTPMMACSAQVPNITVCTINSTRLYIILRSSIESIRNEEKKSRFVSRRILRTRFIEKKKKSPGSDSRIEKKVCGGWCATHRKWVSHLSPRVLLPGSPTANQPFYDDSSKFENRNSKKEKYLQNSCFCRFAVKVEVIPTANTRYVHAHGIASTRGEFSAWKQSKLATGYS